MGQYKAESEQVRCKKQFLFENKFNFLATLVTQSIFSAVSISISFLMMITVEAIEYKDMGRVRAGALFVLSVLILYAIFGYAQKVFRNRYIKSGLSQFKKYIFHKILKKSIREFGTASTGKIINVFSNDLSSIELNYMNGTLQIIQQSVVFVIALIAMFYLNVILAVCVLLACVIPVSFSLLLGRHLVVKEKKTSDEGEGFVDQVKDLLNGFILIKSFKAEKEVLALFDKRNFSLEEAKRDRRDTNDAVTLASTFSSILVTSLVFTIGLVLAYQDIISIGAVIAFVELSHHATGPVEKIFPLWSNRKAAIALIDKIAAVIEEKDHLEQKLNIKNSWSAITMKKIGFSYEAGGKQAPENTVLKNINLTFEKGKSYAIVGSSGCGKSTLIQLLLGYYSDYEGDILIGDTALRKISLDSLYDTISVIQQSVFLFDSSIKDNITMFKSFETDKFNNAVRLAGLSDLIRERGGDYIGGEGGCHLSGGEKQRISIARCLIRETPVLIMDEATAALDNKTAFAVEDAILDLEGLTKIIVTHKFNETIMKRYDHIIVLKDGEIAESGSFTKLMEQKKYFYSLFNVTSH